MDHGVFPSPFVTVTRLCKKSASAGELASGSWWRLVPCVMAVRQDDMGTPVADPPSLKGELLHQHIGGAPNNPG